jgi:hypothetical protein
LHSGFEAYLVDFADYLSSGGPIQMKRIVGEQALNNFLSSIGVQPNNARSVFEDLKTDGTASLLNVILPESTLREKDYWGMCWPLAPGKKKIEIAIRLLRQ